MRSASSQDASRLGCTGLGLRSGYLTGSPNTCRWQSQESGGSGFAGAAAGRTAPAYFSVMGSHRNQKWLLSDTLGVKMKPDAVAELPGQLMAFRGNQRLPSKFP